MLSFLALTYALSWSSWLVARYLPAGEIDLGLLSFSIKVSWGRAFEILGTFWPGFVAIFLVLRIGARAAVAGLLASLGRWRVDIRYFLLSLGLPCGLFLMAAVAHQLTGGSIRFAGPLYILLLSFLLNLPLSPLWEEIGWRGFLLPRLQAKYGGLGASLILGLIWGIWHLPLRLEETPPELHALGFFLIFVLYVVALSVVMTWLYNRTNASLPVVILFHASVNVSRRAFAVVRPIELLPLSAWVCFFSWVAALVITLTAGLDLGSAPKTKAEAA